MDLPSGTLGPVLAEVVVVYGVCLALVGHGVISCVTVYYSQFQKD